MKADLIMMKVQCTLICLLMLGIPGYGCTSQEGFYGEIKKINEQHAFETMRVPDVDIKAYTPEMKAFEVGFTVKELDSMTDYGEHKKAASHLIYEEAAEDVDLAFKVLKDCYGAYFYFGGDKAFERAKKHVLSDCEVAGENLSVDILRESLKRNLGFVKDGHFWIDNGPVIAKAVYFSNEKMLFLRMKRDTTPSKMGRRETMCLL